MVSLAEKRLHYLKKVREIEVRMKAEQGFHDQQTREKNSDYRRVNLSESEKVGTA